MGSFIYYWNVHFLARITIVSQIQYIYCLFFCIRLRQPQAHCEDQYDTGLSTALFCSLSCIRMKIREAHLFSTHAFPCGPHFSAAYALHACLLCLCHWFIYLVHWACSRRRERAFLSLKSPPPNYLSQFLLSRAEDTEWPIITLQPASSSVMPLISWHPYHPSLSFSLSFSLSLSLSLLLHLPGDSERIPCHPTPAVQCENNALVDHQLTNKN